jgi:hypothetical protein
MLTTQEKGRRKAGECVSGALRPGIRVEMSLRGLGRKEFPFTVAMYDGQRVGGQKGKASTNQECALFVQLLCAVSSGRSLIPME